MQAGATLGVVFVHVTLRNLAPRHQVAARLSHYHGVVIAGWALVISHL